MSVPAWVQDSVFYQIFPDRFANGDPANDPPNLQPWGSSPTSWGFQGGDLRGIIQRFDYLLDLGVNALYLNPIFHATSNHRYNTTDYYKIDPKLGSMADFHALLDLAHRHGVRIVLDGVFNHCGRGFFAFSDVLENNQHSPYRDWYHISHFPGRCLLARRSAALQSLVGDQEPAQVQHLQPPHAPRTCSTWRVTGSSKAPMAGAWMCPTRSMTMPFGMSSAIPSNQPTPMPTSWARSGLLTRAGAARAHFDGLMNYPFRECLLAMLSAGAHESSHCVASLELLTHIYPRANVNAMYLPLGTHDTERLFTRLNGDERRLRLAWLCQFAYPGAPAIYYGDEIGLPGGKDPDCRRAFPWDESQWHPGLRDELKKLIAIRKRTPALRRGVYHHLASESHGAAFAFARLPGEECVLVALNMER